MIGCLNSYALSDLYQQELKLDYSVLDLNSISSNIETNGRASMLDNYMITLNNDSRNVTTGPVFVNNTESKKEYTASLYKLILKNAHSFAKRYLDNDDIQGYNSFLVLALTIPLHEGLLVHFREIDYSDKGLCRSKANKGKTIKSKAAKKHFQQAFLKTQVPFLAKCNTLQLNTKIKQMISGGGDGSDLGIMQLSSRWHYDNFLAKGKFKSVNETIKYGLHHAFQGFKRIYANYTNYPCLKDQDNNINYQGLIRGTWAGKYNSGNLGSTCRFSDPKSNYKLHDSGFLNNLNKVLAISETGKVSFNEDLDYSLNENTKKLLSEVVLNYKNKSNNRVYLDKILND